MERIDRSLLERLEKQTGLSRRRVYELVEGRVRLSHLPRRLAAIALASEHGINISKFASNDDLAAIRHSTSHEPIQIVTPVREQKVPLRKERKPTIKRKVTSKTKVFVVHGRDENLRRSMFRFLRAIGLEPIEWSQAVAMTGKGTPYVGDVIRVMDEGAAVVVIVSPDDEARLRKKFQKSRDPTFEKSLTGQARPNVLFEGGMAIALKSDSTVWVEIGETRPFSDFQGRHVVRLDNTARRRMELVNKLRAVGCDVDLSGEDWTDEGDFTTG